MRFDLRYAEIALGAIATTHECRLKCMSLAINVQSRVTKRFYQEVAIRDKQSIWRFEFRCAAAQNLRPAGRRALKVQIFVNLLNIESLLLRVERSQQRWYGLMTRMSQERTAKKLLLCSTPIGRRPRGRPRTRWRDYVDLSWSRLGIPEEHVYFVAEDRDVRRIQLELLPPRPPSG